MTLQQLLDAMNAAKAAMDKSPEDESLKAKFNEAKQAYDAAKAKAEGGEGSEDDDELDESSLDEKTKAYLKKLRSENAKHRTKNKDLASKLSGTEGTLAKLKAALGGEDQDDTDPAELVKSVQAQNEALQVELSIAQLAVEHGISGQDAKYFKFLLSQKFEELEDGQEMTDEDIQGIVSEVQTLGRSKGNSRNSTGLNGGKRPDPDAKDTLTAEQFAKMSIGEKSQLFTKNQAKYDKLFAEAKEKRLL